ncbi:MAG: peroxiredoxin, partial [Cyclobacteriaceae bacterium]
MITLKAGDKAPNFLAKDQDGNDITLAQYKG